MTGLSRCGRRYPSLESAILAGELRTSKGAKPLAVVSCALGDHWHLVPPGNVTGKNDSRPDPFPPVIAALLDVRDEVCQMGGGADGCLGRLERHHRRAKAAGGSSGRAHTQCACNGVKLCRKHHEWVHLNPRKARSYGFIVLQSVRLPGSVAMVPWFVRLSYSEVVNYGTRHLYPTCDGGWNDQP